MESKTVDNTTAIGVGVNVAAGHVGEMTGAAISAAGKATGCPVAQTVGKAISAAGKAWATTAAKVGARDAATLKGA